MKEYIIGMSAEVIERAKNGETIRITPKLQEIVRCRDCVHYKPYRTHKHGMMNRCHDEHGHTHKRDETDFCSRGERRTDE